MLEIGGFELIERLNVCIGRDLFKHTFHLFEMIDQIVWLYSVPTLQTIRPTRNYTKQSYTSQMSMGPGLSFPGRTARRFRTKLNGVFFILTLIISLPSHVLSYTKYHETYFTPFNQISKRRAHVGLERIIVIKFGFDRNASIKPVFTLGYDINRNAHQTQAWYNSETKRVAPRSQIE